MKRHLLIIQAVLVLILSGCASTHPGQMASELSGKATAALNISAQNIEASAKDSFQLVEVTIENPSDEWIKVSNAKVIINDPKLAVVLGQDLRDWAQAMNYRIKKDEHNKQLALGGLALAGAAAAASGSSNNNSGVATAGALLLVGTYAWAINDTINQTLRNAEGVPQTPENHLYTNTSVPGKMFTRKWLLLKKPTGLLINTLVFEIETAEGKKATYQTVL